jgi:hypothetical protein
MLKRVVVSTGIEFEKGIIVSFTAKRPPMEVFA